MLCLKIVRGQPGPGFTSRDDFTELEGPVSIGTLEPLDSDYSEERKQHPDGAIICLLANASFQYVYPGDSAYLIDEYGNTVQTICRGQTLTVK